MDHNRTDLGPFQWSTVLFLLSLVILAKLVIWVACGACANDWSWISAFHKWDSYWYGNIAVQGYQNPLVSQDGSYQSDFAFFPAYPMLASGISSLFHLSVPWAMELLSIPIAFFCLCGAWLFISQNGANARQGTLTFLLWPFSIFLFVHYSDALYIALLLWALAALKCKQDFLATICLALLVVTRPNGIFFIPVVLLFIVHQEAQGRGTPLFLNPVAWRRIFHVLLCPALSFSAWCVVLWRLVGDPFAFNTAQTGWGRELSWPWQGFFASGDFATQFESWYTLVLIAGTTWYWRRLAWPYRIWLVLGILGPLLSGSVDSMTRFALSFIPLIMMVSTDLERSKRPYLMYAVFISLQLFCLCLWALYHPLMA